MNKSKYFPGGSTVRLSCRPLRQPRLSSLPRITLGQPHRAPRCLDATCFAASKVRGGADFATVLLIISSRLFGILVDDHERSGGCTYLSIHLLLVGLLRGPLCFDAADSPDDTETGH